MRELFSLPEKCDRYLTLDREYAGHLRKDFSFFPKYTIICYTAGVQGTLHHFKRT